MIGGFAISADATVRRTRPKRSPLPTRVISTSQPSIERNRAGEISGVPDATSTGTDSASDRCGVQTRATGAYDPVRRDPLARAQFHNVAGTKGLGGTTSAHHAEDFSRYPRVSLPSARIASCEPSKLRSSSTWPTIITKGSKAAVVRSPLAQAPTRASAINWSVTP